MTLYTSTSLSTRAQNAFRTLHANARLKVGAPFTMACFCGPAVLPQARSRTAIPRTVRPHQSPRRARRRVICATAGDGESAREQLRGLETELRQHLTTAGVPAEEFADALAYAALAASGRADLVERIMNAGGYSVALSLFGISPPSPAPEEPPSAPTSVFDPPDDGGGRLALGATLDRRLSAPLPPPGTANAANRDRRRPSARETADQVPSADELVRAPAPPKKVVQAPAPPGERLTLEPAMRAGLLALVAVSAVGFGRASDGVINPAAVAVLREAAKALAGVHVALAVYAAVEAGSRLRRSAPVWFVKVLLAGPAGFIALRRYGVVDETGTE